MTGGRLAGSTSPDCTVEFPDTPMEKIKPIAVEAAYAALAVPATNQPPTLARRGRSP